MPELFEFAFARLDRAKAKRREFGEAWAHYISVHPWDIDVRAVEPCTFEILAVTRVPTPATLSMIFSEWLAALRAALDNGLYDWAVAATGQDPPPGASKLQFPIASTPAEFKSQARRLATLPPAITEALEHVQPYQSPYGPKSNILYWINELARTDRHRAPHIGLGRVEKHKIRLGLPLPVTATFDESVKPYSSIEGELVIGRFTTTAPLRPRQIRCDLRGVEIGPEIRDWADFNINGKQEDLHERMIWTEIYTRVHLESMASMAGAVPPGGFKTFDPGTQPSSPLTPG